MSAPLKVLKWLIDNPGWHFAAEVAAGSATSDQLVYSRAEELISFGFAEQRNEQSRTQYRARLQVTV